MTAYSGYFDYENWNVKWPKVERDYDFVITVSIDENGQIYGFDTLDIFKKDNNWESKRDRHRRVSLGSVNVHRLFWQSRLFVKPGVGTNPYFDSVFKQPIWQVINRDYPWGKYFSINEDGISCIFDMNPSYDGSEWLAPLKGKVQSLGEVHHPNCGEETIWERDDNDEMITPFFEDRFVSISWLKVIELDPKILYVCVNRDGTIYGFTAKPTLFEDDWELTREQRKDEYKVIIAMLTFYQDNHEELIYARPNAIIKKDKIQAAASLFADEFPYLTMNDDGFSVLHKVYPHYTGFSWTGNSGGFHIAVLDNYAANGKYSFVELKNCLKEGTS